MALLFWSSHQPGSEIKLPAFPHSDKVLHFSAYAVLGFCLHKGFRISKWNTMNLLVLCCLGSLYGLSDEWHQSFVPKRDAGWGDWLADTLGSCFGVLLSSYLGRKSQAIEKL